MSFTVWSRDGEIVRRVELFEGWDAKIRARKLQRFLTLQYQESDSKIEFYLLEN